MQEGTFSQRIEFTFESKFLTDVSKLDGANLPRHSYSPPALVKLQKL
jgi:hypothetical protein